MVLFSSLIAWIISDNQNGPIFSYLSSQMYDGVDHLLFSLVILGCLTNGQGAMWQRREIDMYIFEMLTPKTEPSIREVCTFSLNLKNFLNLILEVQNRWDLHSKCPGIGIWQCAWNLAAASLSTGSDPIYSL